MITLRLTCGACPEQYDAFDENGKQVGYLRLRHGYFRVDYPECGGEAIFEGTPSGDGCFEDGERDHYLRCAVDAIERRIKYGPQSRVTPNVQYKIEGGRAGIWIEQED